MPIAGKDAMTFVNQHFTSKQIRNYAVSDLRAFPGPALLAPWPELQKTWALYLKWAALSKANHDYASANGTAFRNPVKFFYTEAPKPANLAEFSGSDLTEALAPTLVSSRGDGVKEAELKGVGQCEYFADLAYGNMKMRSPAGRPGPIVRKVAVPMHNWVLANGGADDAEVVCIDYWLFAMGVPAASCVCLQPKYAFEFDRAKIKTLKIYDPVSGTETVRVELPPLKKG